MNLGSNPCRGAKLFQRTVSPRWSTALPPFERNSCAECASYSVILCDEWTLVQVKAFRLMVNRSVTWADWDEELLALELQESRSRTSIYLSPDSIPARSISCWFSMMNKRPTPLRPAPHFTLSLANGRRIECSWQFAEAELARLIRIAESA